MKIPSVTKLTVTSWAIPTVTKLTVTSWAIPTVTKLTVTNPCNIFEICYDN